MHRIRIAITAGLGAIVAAALFVGVAQSQNTQLGPNATGCTVSTATATQCIAANPTRKGLTICNVGSANGAWIAPSPIVVAKNGIGSLSLPAISSLTASCVNIPAVVFHGPGGTQGLGAAWSMIPDATPATITIWEYN